MDKLKPYTKTVVAAVAFCIQLLMLYVTLSADGNLSSEDINALLGNVLIAVTGTGAVYQLPNKKASS
ncbi:hypothetical protein [Mycolicibacterium sp. PDY-3]|uniref:hypothetical protein n=1 Tax=Mycolicibacterium sp. PDY-3 TaxID=3376069 RepID=UPI0037944A51